jgi:hypothetical protein
MTEGTRTTTKVPTKNGVVIRTVEVWRSAELQVEVLVTISEGSGAIVRRLANISRADPDPALFRPPPGYTVIDEKDSFTVSLKKP